MLLTQQLGGSYCYEGLHVGVDGQLAACHTNTVTPWEITLLSVHFEVCVCVCVGSLVSAALIISTMLTGNPSLTDAVATPLRENAVA